MSVFRAYMKIAKRNMWMILLYLVIFFGITVMFQSFAGGGAQDYQAENVPVGIVDEDQGEAAAALIGYIGRQIKRSCWKTTGKSFRKNCFTGMWTISSGFRKALWKNVSWR